MAGLVVRNDNTRLFFWDGKENLNYLNPAGASPTEAERMKAEQAKVGNITSIGDLGGSSDEIDVTTIDSIGKEYEPGTTDEGTVDITINLVSQSDYQRLLNLKQSGQVFNWAVSSWYRGVQVVGTRGRAYLSSCTLQGISVDGILQVSAGLRISGEIQGGFVDALGASGGTALAGITLVGPGLVAGHDNSYTVTMKKGEKIGLGVNFNPANISNKTVVYASSASDKANVNFMGEIFAVADGTADITVTPQADTTKQAKVTVTVEA